MAGCREIAARWCALAEQRLEHLSEMFETGRWRRYHSEIAFLENIQEAKRAVQTWRALATGADVAAAAASVTPAFGWSPATMPRVFPREQVQTVQPKAVRIAPETAVPVRLNPKPYVLAEITEAPIAPLAAPVAKASPKASAAAAAFKAPAARAPLAAPAAMAPLTATAAMTPPKAPAALAPFKAPTARAPLAAPAATAPLTAPVAMTPPKAPAAVAPLKAPATRAPLTAPAARAPLTTPAAMAALLPQFAPPAAEIVAAPERVVEFTFSLDGLQAKYPLLRNAF
ncbi:hypothetical protein AC629_04395 [Bradyrhizobium sp. NAS80.1]|nr:hypothetical protein AC629_04395 [Bradyrhizobium sp. NAS80.1]